MNSEIVQNIMDKLHQTEAVHQVKIPLAVESGSRGWGFAAANADYDCRFLYAHNRDWYLSVFKKKDFIEYATDEVYDIRGYDITRALRDIAASKAYIYEWLSSNVVYIRSDNTVEKLRGLAADFFNPIQVSYHFLGLARNMLGDIISEDEAKIKKYFYILRPIINLNFIWQYKKMPHMEFDKNLEEASPPQEICFAIKELKEQKLAMREHDKIPRHRLLASYFEEECQKFERRLKEMKHEKNRDYDAVDKVFRSIVEDLWK